MNNICGVTGLTCYDYTGEGCDDCRELSRYYKAQEEKEEEENVYHRCMYEFMDKSNGIMTYEEAYKRVSHMADEVMEMLDSGSAEPTICDHLSSKWGIVWGKEIIEEVTSRRKV